MSKRLPLIILAAIIIVVVAVISVVQYLNTPNTKTNTNVPVSYTTVTDNELVILHLNAKVDASKVGVQLELTSYTQAEGSVDANITVRDNAGAELGTIRFANVDETQTLQSYRFRLISATKSAVQVLALATIADADNDTDVE